MFQVLVIQVWKEQIRYLVCDVTEADGRMDFCSAEWFVHYLRHGPPIMARLRYRNAGTNAVPGRSPPRLNVASVRDGT